MPASFIESLKTKDAELISKVAGTSFTHRLFYEYLKSSSDSFVYNFKDIQILRLMFFASNNICVVNLHFDSQDWVYHIFHVNNRILLWICFAPDVCLLSEPGDTLACYKQVIFVCFW